VIRGRQDIVLAVTIGTHRGHWIAIFCGDTMQTTLVRIRLGPGPRRPICPRPQRFL
jgi:hypothetical protein